MATFRAEAAGDDNIRITITEESVDITVVENYPDLRSFWNRLGVVLNEVEQSL
jgi:hypothetical protein